MKNIETLIKKEFAKVFNNKNLSKIMEDNNENNVVIEYQDKENEKIYHFVYDKNFKTIDLELWQFFQDKKSKNSYVFKYTFTERVQVV